jgi:hypothetical protein
MGAAWGASRAHCDVCVERVCGSALHGTWRDEVGAEEQWKPVPGVQFRIVDSLPGGRVVQPIEGDGWLCWAVVRGEMTDRLCRDLNVYLRHVTGNGLWRQEPGGWSACNTRRKPPHSPLSGRMARWLRRGRFA